MQDSNSELKVLPGGKAAIYPSNIMIRFDEKNALKKCKDGIDDTAVNITIMKSRPKKVGE